MKHQRLLKSGLSMLMVAGVITPLASLAEEGGSASQTQTEWYDSTERGAQGPVRTEFTEPTWSYADGAIYDNLMAIQSASVRETNHRGAQGPIRTEYLGPKWSYAEGATYDNLMALQAESGKATNHRGVQGPIRTEYLGPKWSYAEGATYENLMAIQAESVKAYHR